MKSDEIRYTDPVLCYVSKRVCFFTTRQLDKQWGDDWNDAPYEHNAGCPYEFHKHHADDGIAPWDIVVMDVGLYLNGPEDYSKENEFGDFGSWSVQEINRGDVPWLWSDDVEIYAGTPLSEFTKMIDAAGGTVGPYKPEPGDE